MKRIILFLAIPFLSFGCDDEPEEPQLLMNRYLMTVVDDSGQVVLKAGGDVYDGGGENFTLYWDMDKPNPLPKELWYMTCFLSMDGTGEFRSASLVQRPYSLEGDFGYLATSGTIRTVREASDWRQTQVMTTMVAVAGMPYMNLFANPKWGSSITVFINLKYQLVP